MAVFQQEDPYSELLRPANRRNVVIENKKHSNDNQKSELISQLNKSSSAKHRAGEIQEDVSNYDSEKDQER